MGITIIFQDDGNLVVYDKWRNVKWASGNSRLNGKQKILKWQNDGHLVMYEEGKDYWAPPKNNNACWLRFMSGPPYFMIDSHENDGPVLYSAAPLSHEEDRYK